jgi:hypothetical protein
VAAHQAHARTKKPKQIAWQDGHGDMARQAEMFEFDQRPMTPNKS